MPLTLADVRKVAELARLTLTPAEELRYQEQLSAILASVEQLQRLDTSKVEPTSHASLGESLLRDDAVVPSLDVEKGLANAPARVGTHFAVPKILE